MAGACSLPLCHAQSDTPRLRALLEASGDKVEPAQDSGATLRATALRDAGLAAGLRAGMVDRGNQLRRDLERNAEALDRIYRFNTLMLPSGVMPPVIEEARNALAIEQDTMRHTDLIFRIARPARFVSMAPTWRDYLFVGLLAAPTPERLPKPLLPRNEAETAVWREAVQSGWKAGVEQADKTFDANLSRLRRDYEGMLRYTTLRERNFITEEIVTEARSVVRGGGDQMAVGERFYRLARQPKLNAKPQEWTQRYQSTPSEPRK